MCGMDKHINLLAKTYTLPPPAVVYLDGRGLFKMTPTNST